MWDRDGMGWRAAVLGVYLLWPLGAAAQTICDTDPGLVIAPTAVVADLADHKALALDGDPVIDRYEVRTYLEGGAAPIATQALAREAWTLVSGTCYRAALPSAPIGLGVRYVSRLAAYWDGGEVISEPSNPFGWSLTPRLGTIRRVK